MRFCADPEDIKILTGYSRAKEQRQFLKDKKISFQVDHEGRPVVPIVELERVFGIDSASRNKKKIDFSQFHEESAVQGHATN